MKTTKELEDAVRECQNGNTDSFDRIYELSYGYLYTCVIHVVKDEEAAADMLQETYLEISRNISQLKNAGDFLSWASTIGSRKCYAYLKKQRDVLVRSDGDQNGDAQDFFASIADDEAFIPETILQDREKQRLVQEIIDGLSDMQRLCIIGFYYRGQSIEEIAQELEIPANTVKSHLSRAKAKIKDAVIVLDREKGTRLYSVAPFMLLFLSKEVEACEAGPMPEALKKELDGSGVTNLGARNSLTHQTLMTPLQAVRYKLAAGIVLTTAVIGGGAALIHYANSRNAGEENPSETVLAGAQEDTTQEENGLGEQTETDENLQADTAGESEPEGQEAAPDTETGEQEESGILKIDLTEYETFGYPAGGVMPVKKDGLWGAVNYKNEEIVPCEYPGLRQIPNLAGYFILQSVSEDDTVNEILFAPDGTKVYEGTDYVQALGDFYVVRSMVSSDEGYENKASRRDYYDYDGNHVLSTDFLVPSLWNAYIMGSYDGETPVRRQIRRYNDELEILMADMEVGVLCSDGTVRWNSGFGNLGNEYGEHSWAFMEERSYGCEYPCGTPNHGYTIELNWVSDVTSGVYVYTEDHQSGFELTLTEASDNPAIYPGAFGDVWKGFDYDGAFFRHYGSKAVWEINGTYLLVDLALVDVHDADWEDLTIPPGPGHDGLGGFRGHDYRWADFDWEKVRQASEDHIPRGIVLAAYDYIEMDMNRYWLVQKGDQYGYIDHEGNEMAMYEDASNFANGYALIVEDGTAFLINEDFEIVEECGDADIVRCYGELFEIGKDDKWTYFTYSR